MRISDWSSDVCSSDLARQRGRGAAQVADQRVGFGDRRFAERLETGPRIGDRPLERLHRLVRRRERVAQIAHCGIDVAVDRPLRRGGEATDLLGRLSRLLDRDARVGERARSEEHTSELQSLMRISYAVFSLKKK